MSESTKPKYVQKDNSGSLFTNTYKNNDDSAPDFRGNGAVVCPCCNTSFTIGISGWIKPGKDGRSDWTSFRFKPAAPGGGAVAGSAKPSGWRPGQSQQPSAPARPQSPPSTQRQAYTPPQRQPPPPPRQQAPRVPPENQGVMEEDDVPY